MILMPQRMITDIYGLTDEFLDAHGIRGIIFDIDNTLVGFRTAEPTAENLRLFAHLKERGIPFRCSFVSDQHLNSVIHDGLLTHSMFSGEMQQKGFGK